VNRRLGGAQSLCEHFGEETSETPAGNQHFQGIEPRFFGSPAPSLVAISAALSRLPPTNTDNQFIKKNPTRCNNVSEFYYSIFI